VFWISEVSDPTGLNNAFMESGLVWTGQQRSSNGSSGKVRRSKNLFAVDCSIGWLPQFNAHFI
jgi:hypothetical protein